MRLAVSNIAWSPENRLEAYAALQAHSIRGLEIAPRLFFSRSDDPFLPSASDVEIALREIEDAGLQLVSMQSLLFGVKGAALFGDKQQREAFETGMVRAIRLADKVRIPHLVFGSPVQRTVPVSMARSEATDIAVEAFNRLGDQASATGTVIGIEFNPIRYGTNFLNTAEEALEFVRRVDHKAVKMVLDIGAMIINAEFEKIPPLMSSIGHRLGHIHISEPDLAPAPRHAHTASLVFAATMNAEYSGWHSIEMKAVAVADQLSVLGKSLARLSEAVTTFRERGL